MAMFVVGSNILATSEYVPISRKLKILHNLKRNVSCALDVGFFAIHLHMSNL